MIEGFSKLSREQKIKAIGIDESSQLILENATIKNEEIANIIDELSENTLSHFPFPYGVAPNLMVNGNYLNFPLVTEESSVVAAIAKAAKFWSAFGGFKTKIIGITKIGHVHFFWHGDKNQLINKFEGLKEFIELRVAPLNRNMRKRGGGIVSIELIDKTHILSSYFQIELKFETSDAMGANFINSCLEEVAKSLKQFVTCDRIMDAELLSINMAILSNYTPECRAQAWVSSSVKKLDNYCKSIGVENYSRKFEQAVMIAQNDVSRAVTHNKGIYNGIDALALATGNDWRAIEACGHAYASRNGEYASLSSVLIDNDKFTFLLDIPIAVGTVGGVTKLHPLARLSLKILQNPNAQKLMEYIAVVGLASNFSAINALISSGIQKGHMKMHLNNILNQLQATDEQKTGAKGYFSDRTVSFSEVKNWLSKN